MDIPSKVSKLAEKGKNRNENDNQNSKAPWVADLGLTRMEMPVKVVQSETTRVIVEKLFY